MSQIKKLKQPISPVFEPNQKEWDDKEKEDLSFKSNYEKRKSEILNEDLRLPHQKTIEEIIFDTRIVFLELIKLLMKKENPIPYILSENKNQFSFCLIVIVIGIILLLFSNILK